MSGRRECESWDVDHGVEKARKSFAVIVSFAQEYCLIKATRSVSVCCDEMTIMQMRYCYITSVLLLEDRRLSL